MLVSRFKAMVKRMFHSLPGRPARSVGRKSLGLVADQVAGREAGRRTDLVLAPAGDNFVAKVASYNPFLPSGRTKECHSIIGPGYGRLLKVVPGPLHPFKEYCGLDLSAENVSYLRETFAMPNIRFVQGDADQVRLDAPFDVVWSSLTLKHLFPTFERALFNIASQVQPDCMFFFDVIEGEQHGFEDEAGTYVRWYTRPELSRILATRPLEFVNFDQVSTCRSYVASPRGREESCGDPARPLNSPSRAMTFRESPVGLAGIVWRRGRHTLCV